MTRARTNADNVTADIAGITAGTGITGGGTSGTVTITNSMATAFDTKGDLIGGTGADTFSKLAVGANGTVLTAASGEATGLSWATPSSGSLTQLATGNLSGSAIITISSISQSYKNLYLYLIAPKNAAGVGVPSIRFNGDSAARYSGVNVNNTTNGYSNSTLIKLGNKDVQSGTNTDFFSANISNYYLSTTHKPVFIQTASNNTGQGDDYFGWGNYNQTTAITSIDILNSGANTFTGGTYTLFGVS